MNTHVTCQDVLDALYELIDCEECDRRSGLIDAGSVPGPDARARALMIKHVATCAHCADALDAERHVRALMRGCYETEQASDALRARGISADVAPSAAKFGKQIKAADKRSIPFVWFPGADGELDSVKDIRSGEQVEADAATWQPPAEDATPRITVSPAADCSPADGQDGCEVDAAS